MKKIILSLVLLASMAEAQIQLQSFTAAGPGCPAGSVRVVLAPDGSAFSILYDRYNTEVGASVLNSTQNCSVVLHLLKPRHLGFKIEAADFRGFIGLDQGVTAEQKVRVMSGPNPGHRMLSAEFGSQIWRGPINEEFVLRAVRPVNSRPPVLDCVPAKENTDIVVDSAVQLISNQAQKNGQLTVDTVDGVLLHKFTLKWLDCQPGRGRGGH